MDWGAAGRPMLGRRRQWPGRRRQWPGRGLMLGAGAPAVPAPRPERRPRRACPFVPSVPVRAERACSCRRCLFVPSVPVPPGALDGSEHTGIARARARAVSASSVMDTTRAYPQRQRNGHTGRARLSTRSSTVNSVKHGANSRRACLFVPKVPVPPGTLGVSGLTRRPQAVSASAVTCTGHVHWSRSRVLPAQCPLSRHSRRAHSREVAAHWASAVPAFLKCGTSAQSLAVRHPQLRVQPASRGNTRATDVSCYRDRLRRRLVPRPPLPAPPRAPRPPPARRAPRPPPARRAPGAVERTAHGARRTAHEPPRAATPPEPESPHPPGRRRASSRRARRAPPRSARARC